MPEMARYRKIDVRMRSDEKFRALSAPPPNGQDCWIHLLTNRFTTSIPGLYAAFEETLARDLGWHLEGYRDAFREVYAKGMAMADWGVGLVFVPKAITYDPPQSINVVKSWGDVWDEIPECPLKHEAHRYLKAFIEGMSHGFIEAFDKACAKPCRIPEPEPEQEPEQEKARDARARKPLELALTEPEKQQPPPLPGKPTATQRQTVDRFRAQAEEVLAALSAARRRVNPTARDLEPAYESLRHIADRLEAGKTVADCRHVIAVYEAECKADAKSFRWFNAVTPFRGDNFERNCAADPGAGASDKPSDEGNRAQMRRLGL
jgi:hypothetical protein